MLHQYLHGLADCGYCSPADGLFAAIKQRDKRIDHRPRFRTTQFTETTFGIADFEKPENLLPEFSATEFLIIQD